MEKYRDLFLGSCFLINRLDALRTHGVVMFFSTRALDRPRLVDDHHGLSMYATNTVYFKIIS